MGNHPASPPECQAISAQGRRFRRGKSQRTVRVCAGPTDDRGCRPGAIAICVVAIRQHAVAIRQRTVANGQRCPGLPEVNGTGIPRDCHRQMPRSTIVLPIGVRLGCGRDGIGPRFATVQNRCPRTAPLLTSSLGWAGNVAGLCWRPASRSPQRRCRPRSGLSWWTEVGSSPIPRPVQAMVRKSNWRSIGRAFESRVASRRAACGE